MNYSQSWGPSGRQADKPEALTVKHLRSPASVSPKQDPESWATEINGNKQRK